MATTYNTAFGSLPGYNEMLGATNTTAGGQQPKYDVYSGRAQAQRTAATTGPADTFAKMQAQGLARPAAPGMPEAKPFAQFGGSDQAKALRESLKSQLEQFKQAPSRFDTQAFQQIRGAQRANLQSDFEEQQRKLNEDLARRGLSASTVGAVGAGRLAGAQSRALADIDTQLLQRAAETQAQDRAQLLSEGRGLAELAGTQDLSMFEANRAAQAMEFENKLRAAQFGQQQYEYGGQQAFQAAQAEEEAQRAARQFDLSAIGQTGNLSLELQRLLGQQEIDRAQLTGLLGTGEDAKATLGSKQQEFQQQMQLFERAARLSEQSGYQYTVTDKGNVEPLKDKNNNLVPTSAVSQAELNRQQQKSLTQLEIDLRRQLGLTEATGKLYTGVDEETGAMTFGAETLSASLRQRELAIQNAMRLSEQSGYQYTVAADGTTVEPLKDADGKLVTTSASTQASENRKQQQALAELETNLRRELGLTEATGKLITIDPVTKQPVVSTDTIAGRRAAAEEQQALIQRAMQLSEQSGIQHEVKAGAVVPIVVKGPGGVESTVPTSASNQAKLERSLREQIAMMEATGQAYTRDANTGAVALATGAQAARTIQAQMLAFQKAAQLSEQSGIQHEVKADGTVSPVMVGGQMVGGQLVGGQPLRTSAESRFNLELQFRRQMQLMEQTGDLYNIDAATGRATLASGAEAAITLGRRQQDLQTAQVLSQITGMQYTVDSNGKIVMAPAEKAKETEARRQFSLEQNLRRALGLSEMTGYVYNPDTGNMELVGNATQRTVQGQMAQNQMFLQLAGVLSGLTGDQLEKLKRGEYAAPGKPEIGTVSPDGAWRWNGTAWVPNTTTGGGNDDDGGPD